MQSDGPAAKPPANANRLIRATSPYLLQHAHNPVDWYEWGPEALGRARAEERLIFLSIGYSACHWCHVMAHESFENADVARTMNEHFVNVKVDREERPDLDEVYMRATQILTGGQGGWPMSVWLTPDLEPVYAGTYFPPDARWGRPGFRELCERIARAWREQRDGLRAQGRQVAEALRRELTATSAAAAQPPIGPEFVDEFAARLAAAFDDRSGGLVSGSSNKFPPAMAMDLMLRVAHRRRADEALRRALLDAVTRTLDHMAAGGIYDQLGGGIARYSTDREWLVPHFEKMLYDQALVSRIYLDGYLATGRRAYADVAADIFDYVLRDLQSPRGGFYSSRDADSEGQEGRYYVWTRGEVLEALGAEDGELFCSYYDVSGIGNWEGRNVLHVPRPVEAVAAMHGIAPDEARTRLAAARRKLLAVRDRRVPPHRDEKILCEWNGLMIASLARGGAVLGEPRYVQAAAQAAEAIFERQFRDGRLRRSYREGRVTESAFLADYGCMIEGLLELYEATFERRWIERAVALNRVLTEQYWDEAGGGGYFLTSSDAEAPITRVKQVSDSAVPCGNSVQLANLLRLSVMLGDADLRAMAEKLLAVFAADVRAAPWAAERFLCGVEFALAGPVELAVVGDPSDARTRALLGTIHAAYIPNRVLMLRDPARPEDAPRSPLLEDRPLVNGAPAVYVCRNYACGRPATTIEELRGQLGGGAAGAATGEARTQTP